MRIFAMTAVVVLVLLPQLVIADDAEVLSVIRAAQEQFLASTKSGRVHFDRRSDHPDTGMVRESHGMMEWDEDYAYFDGTTMHTSPGKKDGEYSLHMDDVTKFHHDGKNVLAWIQRMRQPPREPARKGFVMFLPFARVSRSGLYMTMPDPELLMRVDDGFRSGHAVEYVQEKPVTTKGNPMERSVLVKGSIVTVTARFPQRIEVTADFDLDLDCMCTRISSVHHYMDPPLYEMTERTFKKADDDRWYPALTRTDARRGTSDSGIIFVGECTIHEYEPLGERGVKVAAGLNSFGRLPDGTSVNTHDAQGKVRYSTIGKKAEPDEEEGLLEQSSELKAKGLGADKKEEK